MSEEPKPNLKNGFAIADLRDGAMAAGKVDDEEVLLVRRGDEIFAVGAQCTHYHGPLADGLIVDDTVRCPWHHACFSFRTGEALRAPALDPISRWRVVRIGDKVFVREKLPDARQPKRPRNRPSSVVIIGGGAAGLAAADMLRREGYDGPLTMISEDDSPPCDRPNLSKDFLAGTAQEDWIPLRPPDYYTERRIDLVLGSRVELLDVQAKTVQLKNGKKYEYGACLHLRPAQNLFGCQLKGQRIPSTTSAPSMTAVQSLPKLSLPSMQSWWERVLSALKSPPLCEHGESP